MSDLIPRGQRAWQDNPEQPDQKDLGMCPECWSVEACDDCATQQQRQVDDHDRRFSEVYDGRTDIGDHEFPF